MNKETKMNLEENEYTTTSFLELMKERFGVKLSGEEFTGNDVAQYLIRGYTPHRYGNFKITSQVIKGVRIIKVIDPKKESLLEQVKTKLKK
jgi:hypothetical protein